METISGIGNWRLTVRRETEGVTILRAETCDARAILPERLAGLPVTALGDHALAPGGGREAEGEALLVTCGAPGHVCSSDLDNSFSVRNWRLVPFV